MLCGILTLALAACGNTETRGNETQPPVNSETNNNSEEASGASNASGTDTPTGENIDRWLKGIGCGNCTVRR